MSAPVKPSQWTSGPPGVFVLTNKLLELQLRLTRLELGRQLLRAQAVVQAMGGPKRE